MTHFSPQYRPHIDGLRTIAVASVILYHFGLPHLPGGFLGVDMFFVISGFVISKSISKDFASESFSFTSFYARRFRRLLPAAVVVVFVTASTSCIVLFPSSLLQFWKSVAAFSAFSSNIYFFFSSSYFAIESNQMPLLHLWSLGVEEQFYFCYPFIFYLLYKYARSNVSYILLVLAIISLVSCEFVRLYNPQASFYLFPFRSFELIIGCLLAVNAPRDNNTHIGAASVWLGLFLVMASLFYLSEADPLPGLLSLLPCGGTALIIYGAEKSHSVPVRLLGSPPLVFWGKRSYSAYLIHWPAIVLLKAGATDFSSLQSAVVASIVTAVLACACFSLVETPFRTGWLTVRAQTVFALSFSFLAGGFAIALYIPSTGLLQNRFKNEINSIVAYADNYDYAPMFAEGTCFLRPEQGAEEFDAVKCLPSQRADVVVWGDSSIAMYVWGLRPALKQYGLTLGQLTASACRPILGIDVPGRPNCRSFNDLAYNLIAERKPREIVIGAVWEKNEDLKILDSTIAKLQALGSRVLVLGPPMFFRGSVPNIIAQRRMAGDQSDDAFKDLDKEISYDRDERLSAHFLNRHDLTYISTARDVCGGACAISDGSIPLHFDQMHFTREGSDRYAPDLAKLIANLH